MYNQYINNMYDYTDWYQILHKPFFAPPDWLFGIAWGIIYPLIFIALILVAVQFSKHIVTRMTLWLFFFNLLFNVLFGPIQFGLKNNLLSTLDILLVLVTLILLQKRLWHESRIAFWLLTPYLLWGSFATVLQISITLLN